MLAGRVEPERLASILPTAEPAEVYGASLHLPQCLCTRAEVENVFKVSMITSRIQPRRLNLLCWGFQPHPKYRGQQGQYYTLQCWLKTSLHQKL